MRIPKSWMLHKVTHRRLTKRGPRGDEFSDPETIRHCYVEESVKQTRTPGGDVVTSTAQVIVYLGDRLPLEELVTIWPGTPHAREAKVLGFKVLDRKGLMSHQLLYLE
jgi:hypothetical protein